MRRVRTALGLALVFALIVADAPAMAQNFTASRLPKECSEAEPCKTKGISIESELGKYTIGARPEYFKFGPFEIECAALTKALTVGEGAITWETSPVLAMEIRFTKCLTRAHFGTFVAGLQTSFNINTETHKAEPLKIVYHANGFAETGTGETEGEVEINPGTASFAIAQKVCKIAWPAQTIPVAAIKKPEGEYSSATYSTNEVEVPEMLLKRFPSGVQQKLIIDDVFKAMSWKLEEGQCLGEGGFEEEVKTAHGGKTGIFEGAFEVTNNGGNLGWE